MTRLTLPWATPALAREALELWPPRYRGPLRTLHVGENATYDVRAPAGRFALRLYRPGRWPADQVQVEHDFMRHLGRRCHVVPPVLGRGRESLQVTADGGLAALFHWVPGRHVGGPIRPVHLRRVGALLGRMHAAAVRFVPAASRIRWDAATLLGTAQKDARARWPKVIPDHPVPDLATGGRRGRALWKRLGLTEALCHADLHWGNLRAEGDVIHPFDFDDAGVAPLAYDLAIPVWASARGKTIPAWSTRALLEGYAESGAPSVPVVAIELMLWARARLLLAWVLERGELFAPGEQATRARSLAATAARLEGALFDGPA